MGARLSGIRDLLAAVLGTIFYPFHAIYKTIRTFTADLFYYGLYKGDLGKYGRNLTGTLGATFFPFIYYPFRAFKGIYKEATGKYPSYELTPEERLLKVKLKI